MKIFEKIVKDEIVSLVHDKLDPLQFAYQTGKEVEDVKLWAWDFYLLTSLQLLTRCNHIF